MSKQSGFTLLEILVVVVIMGFIASMVAWRFAGQRDAAVVVVRDTNQQRITAVVASYLDRQNGYPSGLVNLVDEQGLVDEFAGQERYLMPTSELDLVLDDNNVRVSFPADFMDRLKPEVHVLSAAEAEALRRMKLTRAYNLNRYDYQGIDPVQIAVEVENRLPGLRESDIQSGLGVLMIGLGADHTTLETTWIGQAATQEDLRSHDDWITPNAIGRILIGLGQETDLVTSGMLASAGLCPQGMANQHTTWNHYNLLLPRLTPTVERLQASPQLAHLETITATSSTGQTRTFNLHQPQPLDNFAIYSPFGLRWGDEGKDEKWRVE